MIKKSLRYRKLLYDAYMFSWPEHNAVLMDQTLHDLRIGDLEAYYELVMKTKPRKPRGYRPRFSRRVPKSHYGSGKLTSK